MRSIRFALALALLAFCVVPLVVWAQRAGSRPPKRAELPRFDSDDYKDIFFADALADGLLGERPANLGSPGAGASGVATTNPNGSSGSGSDTHQGEGIFGWSKLISAATVEDEIKALNLAIDKSVTTPSDFAGRGHKFARRDFSVLALMFAIAGEYDGDIRWKDDAPAVRDAMARLASNLKAGGSTQVYNEAKLRKTDLADLVRGSRFNGSGESEPAASWDSVSDRAPLMKRLEMAHQERLQPMTANKADFTANVEEILHEAEIIAALSEVLTREGMEDAGDDEYESHAHSMQKAALEVIDAVKLNDYDRARSQVGAMGQSCATCHSLYRA